MKIYLHKNFIIGNTNDNNLTDYKYFNQEEYASFKALLLNLIKNQGNFCGANKSSNNNINTKIKKLAEKYNIRHYHFTPECKNNNCNNQYKCKNFLSLKDKKTSSEVLHYLYNKNNNAIVFFGYSRVHDDGNFPKLNIRPLVDRLNYDPKINIDVLDFLSYIKLSNQLKIEITFLNLVFLEKIISVISTSWATLNDYHIQEIELFYEFIVNAAIQLNLDVKRIEFESLQALHDEFKKII